MHTASVQLVLLFLSWLLLCKGDFFLLKPPGVTKNFRGNTARIQLCGLQFEPAFHPVFAPIPFFEFMVGGS